MERLRIAEEQRYVGLEVVKADGSNVQAQPETKPQTRKDIPVGDLVVGPLLGTMGIPVTYVPPQKGIRLVEQPERRQPVVPLASASRPSLARVEAPEKRPLDAPKARVQKAISQLRRLPIFPAKPPTPELTALPTLENRRQEPWTGPDESVPKYRFRPELFDLDQEPTESPDDANQVEPVRFAEHEQPNSEQAFMARTTIIETFEQSTTEVITGEKQQVLQLLEILPESIQIDIAGLESEMVIPVQKQLLMMAEVADRFHQLTLDGKLDGAEAVKIETYLIGMYEGLARNLNITLEPGQIYAFIEAIQDGSYRDTSERADRSKYLPVVLRNAAPKISQNFAYTFQGIKLLLAKIGSFIVARV